MDNLERQEDPLFISRILLESRALYLSYGKKQVIRDADVKIREGEIVSIIGPNGSGKSTLLKGLCRLKRPSGGSVYLGGKEIRSIPTKAVARRIAVLPQVKHVSDDITVRHLVGYGRYPHLKYGAMMRAEDEQIIDEAIAAVRLEPMRERFVGTLSGGEQQRAWIAMALAQRPEILILDEPTTFLDIAHQLEIMETITRLNRESGMTVVMVLHDVNQAVRFSHRICALKEGRIVAFDNSNRLITREMIARLFEIEGAVYRDLENDCPFYIPCKSITERGICETR